MPRQVRPTVLVAYATFVLLGITGGTGGVLLPSQMASYGVSRAMIGITFFTVSVGFVLASLSTGAMVSRLPGPDVPDGRAAPSCYPGFIWPLARHLWRSCWRR